MKVKLVLMVASENAEKLQHSIRDALQIGGRGAETVRPCAFSRELLDYAPGAHPAGGFS